MHGINSTYLQAEITLAQSFFQYSYVVPDVLGAQGLGA